MTESDLRITQRLAAKEACRTMDEVEKFYECYDYHGADFAGVEIGIFGPAPVIFTAPHSILQIREGEEKEADLGTGSLAYFLAQRLGGTSISMIGRQTGDPMTDKDHPFKADVLERAKELRELNGSRVLVVDLHGIGDASAAETGCDIGLGIGSIPNPASGFMVRAYSTTGRQLGFTVKSGLGKFAALKATGITMTALNAGICAIQVEHRPSLRFGADLEARYKCLRLHHAVVTATLAELEALDSLYEVSGKIHIPATL